MMTQTISEPKQCDGSPLEIFELLEATLLHLEPRDLILASGVCSYWRDCISKSPALLRKIYKLPVLCVPGTNPHFIEPNQAARNALMPNRGPHEGVVLDLYDRVERYLLKHVRPGASDEKLQKEKRRYLNLRYEFRAAFIGVRYPNGWPAGLREIHCELCDGFHRKFRFENIHPLLSFLEDTSLCVRGHGTHLNFDFGIVNEHEAPRSCWTHYCAESHEIASRLKRAHNLMQSCGLQNDMFMRPLCTRLITRLRGSRPFYMADNVNGVTLGEAIPFLIQAFKNDISGTQARLHWLLARHDPDEHMSRCWRIIRDRRAAFPTTEDWAEYDRTFPALVELWDNHLWEINAMLKGTALWDETKLWLEAEREGLGHEVSESVIRSGETLGVDDDEDSD